MCDVCGAEPEWLAAPLTEKAPEEAPAAVPPSPMPISASTTAAVDPELREYMREWRRSVAQRQGVPAYIVLHDTSLDELCHRRPSSLAELLQVSESASAKRNCTDSRFCGAGEIRRRRPGQRGGGKKDQPGRRDDAVAGRRQELSGNRPASRSPARHRDRPGG